MQTLEAIVNVNLMIILTVASTLALVCLAAVCASLTVAALRIIFRKGS